MKIEYLADHENLLPVIGKWYFEEWGYLNKEKTLLSEIENLQIYLNKDKIPLMLLAIENDIPIAVAQLKYNEMTIYPQKKHWLGGVYVSKEHRGKGMAKKIISELIKKARLLNVEKLYLQTENLRGGLYAQMGWLPLEQINYHGTDVLVMVKDISLFQNSEPI